VSNNYGIDKNYRLGMIHQWTGDYSHDLFRSWNVGVTYVGTLGSGLDLLRAPNRGPSGLRDPNVQAYYWQSSDGASHANGLSFRLQKRQTKGISGNVVYTLSKSMDDTTATTGNPTVAQDDQNLGAEWGLSNFDRRHQLTGTLAVQLPWGLNRQWLNTGGWLAAIAGGWSLTTNLTWNSGSPLTVRCSTCASDLATGLAGTLRANYTGQPIALGTPTIDEYFNTAAFSIPSAGTFGSSLRNMVIGPGSHLVNATFSRDVQFGRYQGMTISVVANNLLNAVNYGAIDTNVNSRTFGEVLSVQGMRTVRVNMRFRF
jgi:trimeric autotransporter adhesin